MMSGLRRKPPLVLIASYAFDWVILVGTTGVSTVLGDITPYKRPFSIVDLSISFPYTKETIPTWLLIVCAFFAPALIIPAVCFVCVPGSTTPRGTSRARLWRRKLWEWHAGWLGLALSLASAWLLTSASKNLFGKPRPDLLARCQPDLQNVGQYAIGGYDDLKEGVLLVSADICRNTNRKVLDDGFRSFPSGHSSFSAAGLVYLSLWLANKFALGVPWLSAQAEHAVEAFDDGSTSAKHREPTDEAVQHRSVARHHPTLLRATRAAPPIYLLLLVAVPTLAAIYIAATRFSDFRHHGFDVLFGFAVGSVTAYFAFRYYHPPMARSGGWSWTKRDTRASFWLGVGRRGWAERDTGDTIIPPQARHDDAYDEEVLLTSPREGRRDTHAEAPSAVRMRGDTASSDADVELQAMRSGDSRARLREEHQLM